METERIRKKEITGQKYKAVEYVGRPNWKALIRVCTSSEANNHLELNLLTSTFTRWRLHKLLALYHVWSICNV